MTRRFAKLLLVTWMAGTGALAASTIQAQPGAERYAAPPRPEERVRATFCGT